MSSICVFRYKTSSVNIFWLMPLPIENYFKTFNPFSIFTSSHRTHTRLRASLHIIFTNCPSTHSSISSIVINFPFVPPHSPARSEFLGFIHKRTKFTPQLCFLFLHQPWPHVFEHLQNKLLPTRTFTIDQNLRQLLYHSRIAILSFLNYFRGHQYKYSTNTSCIHTWILSYCIIKPACVLVLWPALTIVHFSSAEQLIPCTLFA